MARSKSSTPSTGDRKGRLPSTRRHHHTGHGTNTNARATNALYKVPGMAPMVPEPHTRPGATDDRGGSPRSDGPQSKEHYAQLGQPTGHSRTPQVPPGPPQGLRGETLSTALLKRRRLRGPQGTTKHMATRATGIQASSTTIPRRTPTPQGKTNPLRLPSTKDHLRLDERRSGISHGNAGGI